MDIDKTAKRDAILEWLRGDIDAEQTAAQLGISRGEVEAHYRSYAAGKLPQIDGQLNVGIGKKRRSNAIAGAWRTRRRIR